ncbi:MAG TPA: hypothetical protein VEL76_35560 [Gemmataceae bacterium]|nr:hypothetical protein [Gemmataceae bacterium]
MRIVNKDMRLKTGSKNNEGQLSKPTKDLIAEIRAVILAKGSIGDIAKACSEIYEYNHSTDRDPENAFSDNKKDTILVFYQPAKSGEEVISDKPECSGKRRLMVKLEQSGDSSDPVCLLSMYIASHPNEARGLRTNTYQLGGIIILDPPPGI